jgi:hypothetical protein
MKVVYHARNESNEGSEVAGEGQTQAEVEMKVVVGEVISI